MKNKTMYCLVDQMNRIWSFDETKKEAESLLACQDNKEFYRIEKVKANDYLDDDGTPFNLLYQG